MGTVVGAVVVEDDEVSDVEDVDEALLVMSELMTDEDEDVVNSEADDDDADEATDEEEADDDEADEDGVVVDEAEDELMEDDTDDDATDDDETDDDADEELIDATLVLNEVAEPLAVSLGEIVDETLELLALTLDELDELARLDVLDVRSEDDTNVLLEEPLVRELVADELVSDVEPDETTLDDWVEEGTEATEDPLDDRDVELLEDETPGLNLYKLKPLGPPQYSNLSAEQIMLQRPSVASSEAELMTLEQ